MPNDDAPVIDIAGDDPMEGNESENELETDEEQLERVQREERERRMQECQRQAKECALGTGASGSKSLLPGVSERKLGEDQKERGRATGCICGVRIPIQQDGNSLRR